MAAGLTETGLKQKRKQRGNDQNDYRETMNQRRSGGKRPVNTN